MCGITGMLHQRQPISSEVLGSMTQCLTHRGPDDDGEFITPDRKLGLGFRRLSIIDLSEKGHQPMFDVTGKACIIFNGEIYNFRELRAELEGRGRKFVSRTDSEVLLNAYLEWGTDCLDRLNGMFAFAIWDVGKRELFLARDRFGIKPLFYTHSDDLFAFASELKSLLKIPEVPTEIDPHAVWNYLTLLQIPAPQTIYAGIRKLLPAHAMVVKHDGTLRMWKYWLPETKELNLSVAELQERLVHELREAVRRHLVTDVPLGVFLSGGIDSSAIVALASQAGGDPLRTFSVSFSDDRELDEAPYQKMIVERYKTNHTEFRVTPDILTASEIILRSADEPFAVSSAIPLYYISKAASEHVKVVLSGDGGDELFAGYEPRYRIAGKIQFMDHVPGPFRSFFSAAGGLIPQSATGSRVLRRGKRASELATLSVDERYLYSFGVFNKTQKQKLLMGHIQHEIRPDFGEQYQSVFDGAPPDVPRRHFHIDMMTALADEMLTKVDRCTSAVSIEGRVPFLDMQLAEFALGIPLRHKYDGGVGKVILRQALEGLLPKEILWGAKRGFNVPMDRWTKERSADIERQLVGESSPEFRQYFNVGEIKRILDVHCRHNMRFGHHLWALMQFEQWLESDSARRSAA